MVNVVGNSFQGYNHNQYLELNHQLAKELAEARQQNGQAALVITQQKEELHREKEQNLDLKQQLTLLKEELHRKEEQLKAIRIILDKPPVEGLPAEHIRAIEAAPVQQREVLSLPGPQEESSFQATISSANDVDDDNGDGCDDEEVDDASVSTRDAAETADRLSDQPLHRISERSEEEEEEEESTKEQSNNMDKTSQSQTTTNLSQSGKSKSIDITLTESGLDVPYPNTFVPPIDHSDNSIRTSSVFNILDTIDKTPAKSVVEKNPETPRLRELNSNTIDSTTSATSSPIHPIYAKTNSNNVCHTTRQLGDIFHSTPVLSQKNPLVRNIQLTDIEQSQTSEYWGTQKSTNHLEQQQPVQEQQPPRQDDRAPRYNLRKRTKKC